MNSSSSTISDSSSYSGDPARAALSESRSTSRRSGSTSAKPTRLDRPASTVVIEASSFNSQSTSPDPSTTPKKSKVSKLDLLGEPSSDSSGSLSMFSDNREDANDLLALSQYAALPATLVPRDQWIPGYSCRVTR